MSNRKALAVTKIDRMLQERGHRTGKNRSARPIVFASKRQGSLLFCVDYCKLNAVTIHDLYPLHRMDGCINSQCDAQFVQTLHASSGYWQAEIDEHKREKTALQATVACVNLFGCHLIYKTPLPPSKRLWALYYRLWNGSRHLYTWKTLSFFRKPLVIM